MFSNEIRNSRKLPDGVYWVYDKVYPHTHTTSTWFYLFKRLANPKVLKSCPCMEANYPFERVTINRLSLAIKLDKDLSPEKCVDYFLENVEFEDNKKGISQASIYFFNKPIENLTSREIAILILMTKAPSHYNYRRNPKTVDNALNRILSKDLD